jgi:hypothetical protein
VHSTLRDTKTPYTKRRALNQNYGNRNKNDRIELEIPN